MNENQNNLKKFDCSSKQGLFEVLTWLKNELKNINAQNEAEWIVAFALNKKRNEIFLTKTISDEEINKIKKILKKRLKRIPLNRILGFEEFCGNKFFINKNVLAPRNETEILVEKVLQKINQNATILDLCTGSGIIAISIKKALKSAQVYASDISQKALNIAKKNAQLNEVEINFIKSNMFEKFKPNLQFDLIVSNPPYIKTNDIFKLEDEVKNHDPHLALDGGKDGLKFYRQIIKNAKNFLKPEGILIFEIGKGQKNKIEKLLLKENYKQIEVFLDYNNFPRVISAIKGF